METQIDQSYLELEQYVPTSSVPNITARTDKVRIDVSLSCENGLDGEIETFYSTSLYPFNGVAELSDVGTLVEEYFRLRNKVTDLITISFDGVSIDVHFLYCEYRMPYDFAADKTFFLSSMVQRVHQDSIIAIAAFNHGSAFPFVIKAVGHAEADNQLVAVEKSVQQAFFNGVAYFNVADIILWALNKTEDEVGVDLRDVMYFSIEYAGIQKMCYIVPAPAYLTFSFRNAFNVEEFIDVVGVMTTKTNVSRDVAVCNGISKQYDRTIERTYQIQTEALTPDEVKIFEQFLASHSVSLWLDGDDYTVNIEDHTCEPSSADDSLTSIKFTWRFDDNRPHVFDSLMDGVMPNRRQIFNDTFSPEYE